MNQRWRCSDVPWVKLSGTTVPCACRCSRVVADRGGGLQRRLDIARLEECLPLAVRHAWPRRRRSSRPAARPAPGCGWLPPGCRPSAAALLRLAGCRAGSARDGRPRARSHKPARTRQALPLQPRKRVSMLAEERGVEIDLAGRSGNRTAPSRSARCRRPTGRGAENITSVGAR